MNRVNTSILSEHKFIQMRDEVELHAEILERDCSCWLIVTHGIGEHLKRHLYLKELFSQNFNILFYDLRGHGRSLGESAYISDFEIFYHDLHELIHFLSNRYKMKRFKLFGHSMGALITSGYIQNFVDSSFYPETIFLSLPPVGLPGFLGEALNGTPLGLIDAFTKFPYSLKIPGMVNLDNLSHDSRIKEEFFEDDLTCKKLHSKLLLELVKATRQVFSKALKPQCPAYVTYGSEDKIISPEAIELYFSDVEKFFTIKKFSGAYHEIHNEVEKYRRPYFSFLKDSLLNE